MDKVPHLGSGERSSISVVRWVKNLAAGLHVRSIRRQHALLFVIPGGSGGFPSINVDLYRSNGAFRDSIECTGAIFEEMLGCNAAAAFRGEKEQPTTPELERRNELVHHGMTRIALIDQWRAAGVTPDGAVGVSLGEVISPYAAGAISREDSARLVAVVAQAVTRTVSAYRVYVVAVNAENARRLCRNAPVRVDFLGASSPDLSLVLCRERESEIVRSYFGDAIVKEAPSGWRYHTPSMHFDQEWVRAQLPRGVTLRPVQRPIYSPAVGGQLPGETRFDAQYLHWVMSGPSHFADAVSVALTDGFDAFVQLSAKPLHIFADVAQTAEAQGRRVRQFQSIDVKALAEVRRMKRRGVTPRGSMPPAMPELDDGWWRDVREESRDLATERISEHLLPPLVEGKPFDVVSALADPLADAIAVDRDELRRLLASSVLALLQDDGIRQRMAGDLELVHANGDGSVQGKPAPRTAAIAALRALLRLAPDFAVFQPLNTVHRVNGEILQLVIAR